jgi:hypothetical protein
MFADSPPHQSVGTPVVHGSIAILHDEDTGLMCVTSEGDIDGDGGVISERQSISYVVCKQHQKD